VTAMLLRLGCRQALRMNRACTKRACFQRVFTVKHAHTASIDQAREKPALFKDIHSLDPLGSADAEFRKALLQANYTAAVDLMRSSAAADAPLEWAHHLQLLADKPEADRVDAYEQLMSICIEQQQWRDALDLWRHLIAEGLQPSEMCCLKVMRAVNTGERSYETTLQAYDALLQLTGEPTKYAAQSAVNAACKFADVPRLRQVLNAAATAGLHLQLWTYLTSLKVFSEAACWQDSLDCLEILLERNAGRHDATAAYCYAMHAFSASGHCKQALRLLREMQQSTGRCDLSTTGLLWQSPDSSLMQTARRRGAL
jgi:pentatricopeptide repeat protein